jgi:hypothetical protein
MFPYGHAMQPCPSLVRCLQDICMLTLTTPPPSTLATSCNPRYGVHDSCAPCSSTVTTINYIVLATSTVGAASVLACCAVIVVILAQGSNSESIRDRLIIGMMSANAVYSLANAIPLDSLVDSVTACG